MTKKSIKYSHFTHTFTLILEGISRSYMNDVMYICLHSSHSSIRARPRRSNASLIMRRLEEVSLQPVLPPVPPLPMDDVDPPGLPSYEQAIAKSGQHDAPPPPYPGYMHLCLQFVFVTHFSSFSSYTCTESEVRRR